MIHLLRMHLFRSVDTTGTHSVTPTSQHTHRRNKIQIAFRKMHQIFCWKWDGKYISSFQDDLRRWPLKMVLLLPLLLLLGESYFLLLLGEFLFSCSCLVSFSSCLVSAFSTFCLVSAHSTPLELWKFWSSSCNIVKTLFLFCGYLKCQCRSVMV